MSKPGDVLEFRSGLHGIEAPNNLGIQVQRYRKKGTPWVQLVTLQGLLDIKAEHISKRAFRERFDGSLKNVEEATARLRFLLSQHTDGRLVEAGEDDLAALEEALWELCADEDRAWLDSELAEAYYGTPSKVQLASVKEALERCRAPGVGRFEQGEKGDMWRPWMRAERDEMRRSWQHLELLRKKLVLAEQTDEGRAFARVDLAEAGLDGTDERTLAWVKDAMVQYVEHDGVPKKGIRGIAGLGATIAFGMHLHRQLGFLAQDWIQSEHTTTSSDYVHFLLEMGLWSPEDAVASLTRRQVNREPFFEHVEDPDAEAAADALPNPAPEDGREDLRHLECYTIDPPDAKDFDDAVGIESIPGGTRLWVHIADVSHYVQQGTLLDRHARKRATSVYLPGRVLPMLPHRIADHLCSLRDDGDRFALSVAMDVSAGRIQSTSFHKSLIRVNENLSYQDALDRADMGSEPFVSLLQLAKDMRSHRHGLDLETGEMRVSVEEDGFQAVEKFGNDATQMIETFMVAANVAVASHLSNEAIPLLYRCHPLPDPKKADRLANQLPILGLETQLELPSAGEPSLLDQLKSGGGLTIGMSIKGLPAKEVPEDDGGEEPVDRGFATLSEEDRRAWLAPFRELLQEIKHLKNRDLAEVSTLKLLACMQRAHYAPENEGHFGLASTHYCHFTSPIRRYPDLVVHRNLKWYIEGQQGPMPHLAEDLQNMCDHCSAQERAAADLERRVKFACLVLASMHGENAFSAASARITGIVPGGVFVLLDDGTEARISSRDLPGGPYEVDEWESMLFRGSQTPEGRGFKEHYDEEYGETRHVRAMLGDRVMVRLTGRNVAEGKTSATITSWT